LNVPLDPLERRVYPLENPVPQLTAAFLVLDDDLLGSGHLVILQLNATGMCPESM
jgi:hypothetical protein